MDDNEDVANVVFQRTVGTEVVRILSSPVPSGIYRCECQGFITLMGQHSQIQISS